MRASSHHPALYRRSLRARSPAYMMVTCRASCRAPGCMLAPTLMPIDVLDPLPANAPAPAPAPL